MKKIYLIKKDVNKPAVEGNWIEMNSYEFAMFMKTDEGKRRRKNFGQIDACSTDECIVIAECGEEKAKLWRSEKDSHDYLKETEKEMGYTVFSYNEQQGTEDDLSGEELIEDYEINIENEVMEKIIIIALHKGLQTLSREEKMLIQQLYLNEQPITVAEFSRKYKIASTTVYSRRETILKKLKKVNKNILF